MLRWDRGLRPVLLISEMRLSTKVPPSTQISRQRKPSAFWRSPAAPAISMMAAACAFNLMQKGLLACAEGAKEACR